jgi:hypothetical protein
MRILTVLPPPAMAVGRTVATASYWTSVKLDMKRFDLVEALFDDKMVSREEKV